MRKIRDREPLLILTASGVVTVVEAARRAGTTWARFVLAAPLGATAVMLLSYLPVYGTSLRAMADISRAPYDLAEAHGLDHAIVFVQSLPSTQRPPYSWAYYPRNNSPDLSDPVLYVRYLAPERQQVLLRHFPDRAGYIMAVRDNALVLIPMAR